MICSRSGHHPKPGQEINRKTFIIQKMTAGRHFYALLRVSKETWCHTSWTIFIIVLRKNFRILFLQGGSGLGPRCGSGSRTNIRYRYLFRIRLDPKDPDRIGSGSTVLKTRDVWFRIRLWNLEPTVDFYSILISTYKPFKFSKFTVFIEKEYRFSRAPFRFIQITIRVNSSDLEHCRF